MPLPLSPFFLASSKINFIKKIRGAFFVLLISVVPVFLFDFFLGYKILNYPELKFEEAIREQQRLEKSWRVKHDFFHHGLRSNFRGRMNWNHPFRQYEVCTDQNGFKSSCSSGKLDGKKFNFVFIGDSFTEGIGLPYEETFVGMIASARPDVSVANMGVASYSPSIYRSKIKYYLDKGYEFDHVVVFIDISDILDEVIISTLKDGRVSENKTELVSVNNTKSQPTEPNELKQHLRRLFPLSYNGLHKIKNLVTGNRGSEVFYHPNPRAAWTYDLSSVGYGEKGAQYALDKSVSEMNELYKMLSKKGITLSVGVYPWPDQLLFDSEDSLQTRVWEEFCRNRCKSFYNLFPVFWEGVSRHGAVNTIKEYYFVGDVHFNERGNRLLADEVLQSLLH